ncbi:MAG: hypothetical protein KJZ58_05625 [Flavobacteriales bacterium]|nr:hypothetical protein [Flavobacteriales bacterium]MCL4281726.1 hypothetical protein [Flavobacteriales bacterium]
MRILPLVLLFLFSGVAGAQDKINLMNGQVLEGKVVGQSTLEIRYLVPKKDRWVERAEPTSGVFSVTDSLGQEKVWYFMDTLFGNEYTVPQMRWFINGERDARNGYKPWGPVIGGFALGAGLTMALDLEVNSLLIPPVYAGLMAWPRVYVTRGSISDPNMEGDPIYATGYSAAGRPKRVVKSLLSTAAGVAAGLLMNKLVLDPARNP